MINDIRALQQEGAVANPGSNTNECLFNAYARHTANDANCPYIYQVTEHVCDFLKRTYGSLRRSWHPTITYFLDPGFGFGKTLQHNCQILDELDKVCA